MYSKTQTTNSMKDFSGEINQLSKQLSESDTVIIGAGAGLSAAAGFTYSGKRFENYFPDFIEKYGFQDMYDAGFYPYQTLEEYWAYWSRYIYINRYGQDAGQPYEALQKLVKDKDYFVLTTNVDHCFQKAGFDKQRLFYTQGDYGLWQCSKPCCKKTYDNEAVVRQMVSEQKNMRIPTDLIPCCPVCGAPMSMNLRADNTFVEEEGWHIAAKRYQDFTNKHADDPILYLELGVGQNTPGIIKYPFWQMVYRNKKACYACINIADTRTPLNIKDRSIAVTWDLREVLEHLYRLSVLNHA